MDLSETALAAIGRMIDSRITSAVTGLEERIYSRLESRLDERVDARIAALQKDYDDKLSAQNAKIAALERRNVALEDELDELYYRVEEQEQRGRRYNVRVENVPFAVDPRAETNDQCFQQVAKKLGELDVTVAENEVVRCHRTSKPRTLDDGTKVAQAIVKVAFWSTRKKLNGINKTARNKGKPVRVFHDLTNERQDVLQYARSRVDRAMNSKFSKDEMKNLPEDEKCFVYANINCELLLKIGGRDFPFRCVEEFDELFRDKFSFR